MLSSERVITEHSLYFTKYIFFDKQLFTLSYIEFQMNYEINLFSLYYFKFIKFLVENIFYFKVHRFQSYLIVFALSNE